MFTPSASSIRVLVVDDDQRFVLAVTALLESEGMKVVGSAKDGAEALHAAAALLPDVVTLDIDMPIMDGAEATQRLRQNHGRLPIVLLSGSDSSERITAARAFGATAHVEKQHAATELTDAVRAVALSATV